MGSTEAIRIPVCPRFHDSQTGIALQVIKPVTVQVSGI